MAHGEQINPAVLVRTRESAGLDLKDAAHRLGLAVSDSAASESKLLELERGALLPSRTQLSNSRKPAVGLLTFHLAIPQPKADRGSYFRTLGPPISSRDNAFLDAVLRDVKARHRCLQAF